MLFVFDFEFWTFVVAIVSAVLALLAVLVTVWFGRREIRLAEEQLTLARKEAENRPVLEVTTIDLIDPTQVDAVIETAQERKSWLNKLERYDRAKRRYEEEKESEEQERILFPSLYKRDSSNLVDIGPQDPRRIRDPHRIYQQEYDGPYPDKVLRVTLANKGKTAALDISGQLYFDTTCLEPFDFPDLNGNVENEGKDNDTKKANLYTGEGSRLLPAPTGEAFTFDIAVLVKQPGTTHIRYAFATPQGDNVEDSWPLDIPAS